MLKVTKTRNGQEVLIVKRNWNVSRMRRKAYQYFNQKHS